MGCSATFGTWYHPLKGNSYKLTLIVDIMPIWAVKVNAKSANDFNTGFLMPRRSIAVLQLTKN